MSDRLHRNPLRHFLIFPSLPQRSLERSGLPSPAAPCASAHPANPEYALHDPDSRKRDAQSQREAVSTGKPDGFAFEPGQATELSLPREEDLTDDKHPFTFTSLPEDRWLEFTIKIYPEHEVWELGSVGIGVRVQNLDKSGAKS